MIIFFPPSSSCCKITVAKSKSKYILVRMKSAAETGYCFNVRRLRLQEKLVLLRYDPIAKQRVLFTEKRKIRSL
ncbi:39S ribosomal protein L33, mitochondrial isoform X3 [Numida meleagris]|uniref:39S ribosomal protein L33, mitochondrial isoform X3 n=1 Tax=Numida meleagris TaxID=8996 RepID=UPI000B3DA9E2|nr:39S ribosomal protein L33, mitochondrial isoform X3 [Numida meleagris]XP_021248356.1 39S ribosomal protein L33, mitochondrial isoform X3 [Numida meleagris]